MTGVEDTVRRSLRGQVDGQPPMHDPAGRAITGARSVRTRRLVAGTAAGAMVFVLAFGALAVLRGHQAPPTGGVTGTATTRSAPPSPAGPSVPASAGTPTSDGTGPVPVNAALLVDRRTLLTGDGGRVDLSSVPGGAVGGHRTRDGWLIDGYGSGNSGMSLWLVRTDHSLHLMVTGSVSRVAVAPDGRRLAWRAADKFYTGHITDSASLVIDQQSPAPEQGAPIAYTGTAVYIGATRTGGGIDMHDSWVPARGGYVPSWDNPNQVMAVFGVAPDGRSLLGLVQQTAGSKQPCLALLDPADRLRPTRRACTAVPLAEGLVPTSPDGRWLVVPEPGGSARVFDLATVFDKPAVAASWQVGGVGVWLDATTMVAVKGAGGLVRIQVGPHGEATVVQPATVAGLAAVPAADPHELTLLTPLN